MDALLILGGLLMILTGLVWLVMRAFSVNLPWGWAALLPPLTLLFVIYHWQRARQALVLCALGTIPLIVGLSVTAGEDPQRFEALVGLQWLHPQPEAAPLQIQLNGQLNGEAFAPQEGELVDGILSLREGQDFFARRELVIRGLPVSGQSVRIDVLPTDKGRQPEIELSWLLAEQELPEARQLTAGYTLHLDLQAQAPNLLVGDFHLVLPPQLQTSLSGQVQLFSNGLRYRDGAVDRQIDSRDTLAYVLEDYLQRRFATRQVQLDRLAPVSFPARELRLDIQAEVEGAPQQLSLTMSKAQGFGWRVNDDRYPPLPPAAEAAALPVQAPAPVAAAAGAAQPQAAGQRDFSLLTLLGDPQLYVNRSLRIISDQGTSSQGRFVELDGEGQIVLRQRLNGSGEARFAVNPDNVSHIVLLDP